MNIGIDIMGGDFAPKNTVLGAIQANEELYNSGHRLVLIGDKAITLELLKEANAPIDQFTIEHAPDIIGMGEQPTRALVQKPNSSIAVGFKLLKENKIDAFSSAGNTGAMLVGSISLNNSIPGIIRPCTLSQVPQEEGGISIILDVGTVPDCKPEMLYQFAVIGSVYAQQVLHIDNPKVGLLNIGTEEEKGSLLTQAAFRMMNNTKDFNFIGNIESRDLFKSKVDVIVCDGFTGNIVLKEAEAFFRLMIKRKLVDDYFKRFNYEIYGGTPILGINSTVLIGHGISSPLAIKNMILQSKEVYEANLPEMIGKALHNFIQTKNN